MNVVGGVGIFGIILSIILTVKIGSVLFSCMWGTPRAFLGAYFVLFCIVWAVVNVVLGKLLGMDSGNSSGANYSYESYDSEQVRDNSGYSDEYSDDYSYEEEYDDWDPADEYILPYSDYDYVDKEQLRELSKEELRIARNEIMARHGRKFKDAALMSYFEEKSWYYPEYEPDEFDAQMSNILNAVEKQNVEMIKEEEARR